MARLEMDEVRKKRILGGEKITVEENGEFFIPYNEIKVELIGGCIVINFMNDGVNVAWFQSDFGGTLTVTGIEARLKVNME